MTGSLVDEATFIGDNAASTRRPPVNNEWTWSDEAVLDGYRVTLMSEVSGSFVGIKRQAEEKAHMSYKSMIVVQALLVLSLRVPVTGLARTQIGLTSTTKGSSN